MNSGAATDFLARVATGGGKAVVGKAVAGKAVAGKVAAQMVGGKVVVAKRHIPSLSDCQPLPPLARRS